MKKIQNVLVFVFCFMLFTSTINAEGLTNFYTTPLTNETPVSNDEVSEIYFDLTQLPLNEEIVLIDKDGRLLSIKITPELPKLRAYDSGWSGGYVPWENSTLSINAVSDTNYVRFSVIANGQYSRLSNFGNLSYRIGLYTLQNMYAGIRNANATNSLNELAEWSTSAVLIQGRIVIGSKNMFVRMELRADGKTRLSYRLE